MWLMINTKLLNITVLMPFCFCFAANADPREGARIADTGVERMGDGGWGGGGVTSVSATCFYWEKPSSPRLNCIYCAHTVSHKLKYPPKSLFYSLKERYWFRIPLLPWTFTWIYFSRKHLSCINTAPIWNAEDAVICGAWSHVDSAKNNKRFKMNCPARMLCFLPFNQKFFLF